MFYRLTSWLVLLSSSKFLIIFILKFFLVSLTREELQSYTSIFMLNDKLVSCEEIVRIVVGLDTIKCEYGLSVIRFSLIFRILLWYSRNVICYQSLSSLTMNIGLNKILLLFVCSCIFYYCYYRLNLKCVQEFIQD